MDRRLDQLSDLDRVVRGNISTATDDYIIQLKQRFVELKENFDRGTIVQTFVMVHNVEQSVHQLSSTLEEINRLGQFSWSLCLLLLFTNYLNAYRTRKATGPTTWIESGWCQIQPIACLLEWNAKKATGRHL